MASMWARKRLLPKGWLWLRASLAPSFFLFFFSTSSLCQGICFHSRSFALTRTLTMTRHILTILFLVSYASTGFAQQTGAEDPVSVRVDKISLPHLIIAIASISKRNVVVGPGVGGERMSIHEKFKSPADFYARVAQAVSAESIDLDGGTIIKNRCVPSPTRLLSSGSDERITLHFERTGADTIAAILDDVYSVRVEAPEGVAKDILDAPISVSVHNASEIVTWNAMAVALGMDITRNEDRTIFLREAPAGNGCRINRSAFALEARGLTNDFRLRACGGGVPDEPGKAMECEPLEKYPLSSITAKGFVTYKNKRVAMVEIPNGQIYPVSQGSYMGYNFGKVAGISDKGIHIQEIVLNKRAKWERRRAFLAFSQPKH